MPIISATQTVTNRPPASILIASCFITLCSFALALFDISLVLASLKVPNNPVYATGNQTRGFIFIAALILFGAILLVRGVINLLKKRRPTILFITLGIPLFLGSIGEAIDVSGSDFFGSTNATSNLIGFGILLLFAIPIILLILPSSKKWYSS